MRALQRVSVIALSFCLWSATASAQGVDVGVSGIGLVSVQPADEGLGDVYLDVDIRSVRPGFGVGVSAIAPSGFVVAAEFSRAGLEGTASGRSINGSGADQGRLRDVRLNSWLVSGLLGYSITMDRTRVLFLVGAVSTSTRSVWMVPPTISIHRR